MLYINAGCMCSNYAQVHTKKAELKKKLSKTTFLHNLDDIMQLYFPIFFSYIYLRCPN